jgi:hypothetical protein
MPQSGKNSIAEDGQQVQAGQPEQPTQTPVTGTGKPQPQGSKGIYPKVKATGRIPRMHGPEQRRPVQRPAPCIKRGRADIHKMQPTDSIQSAIVSDLPRTDRAAAIVEDGQGEKNFLRQDHRVTLLQNTPPTD